MSAHESENRLAAADPAQQRQWLRALLRGGGFPHPAHEPELLETHISFVILAGDYAYKIKKALDLGFLDYSTLEKRRFYCAEELRLNRRLAPDLYLDVVSIGGPEEAPVLGGAAPVLEYAVQMRRFAQECLADHVLQQGGLSPQQVDALAALVADFHRQAAVAAPEQGYGTAEAVMAPVWENFRQIRGLLVAGEDDGVLAELERWSEAQWLILQALFAERLAAGFVRDCHGDLHLGNTILLEQGPRVFDCIEFNPALRWIDVMSDLAFLVMDLASRERADYAYRVLNGVLEHSGDYAGLRLLPFYLAYRAMVRAKVARIRAAQPALSAEQRAEALAGYQRYLAYARQVSRPPAPALIITHGCSGAGKTFVSQAALQDLGAIRLRSDVERKRLYQLAPLDSSADAGIATGLYSAAATHATYLQLECLAAQVLAAGFPVIIDAAFLKQWQRDAFRQLAQRRAVPFLLLDCQAPPAVLRQRLLARANDASEATLAVLEYQLATAEPLTAEEAASTLRIDTVADAMPAVLRALRRHIAQCR